ncbi:YceI family protein [Antrihabitans sp. YC2-6]|uniref:YceI family protein n=1 Tax=Antrihabitans sp. YC2-6 TaxID=2799498 RepID=UPI0018F78E49|nr:YceI family protein [Antrihabitans sp. YC2-6]MBJ8348052.1 YceI family protein [Antrihabitans sp. YC2-6]
MTLSTDTTLAAGSWVLDSAHSSVGFTVRHLGIAKVRGRFTKFDTTFVVDESGAAEIGAVVALDSFDTGNEQRDAHVRNADFLDVERRPTMTFRATEPVRIAPNFVVTGDVSIGTATAPIALEVEWGGVQEFSATGDRHAGFSAVGRIKRSDFGVGPQVAGMLSDTVQVELEIQLIEPR